MTTLQKFNHSVRGWGLGAMVMHLFRRLIEHHPLHAEEHVGMYAGSLCSKDTWEH